MNNRVCDIMFQAFVQTVLSGFVNAERGAESSQQPCKTDCYFMSWCSLQTVALGCIIYPVPCFMCTLFRLNSKSFQYSTRWFLCLSKLDKQQQPKSPPIFTLSCVFLLIPASYQPY